MSPVLGVGEALTVTVTEALLVPPAPEQEIAYAVVEVGEIDWEPVVAVELVQPGGEDAEQELALTLLQDRVLLPPELMVVGLDDRETVGRGAFPSVQLLVVPLGTHVESVKSCISSTPTPGWLPYRTIE
jgi:hypothetical protein